MDKATEDFVWEQSDAEQRRNDSMTDSALSDPSHPEPAESAPEELLSRLTQAVLWINRDLDADVVLQRVLDGARSLTGAGYGAILAFDEAGRVDDFITSGIAPEDIEAIAVSPQGFGLLGYLNEVDGPVRLGDIAEHPRSVGFPAGHPPMKTFLGAPIHYRGQRLGNIYLTEKEGGREFTSADEETLDLFASQAAVAVVNARRLRDEQRARADLQTLVELSPVGVLIFDAKTRALISHNPETQRIVRNLRAPGFSLQELLSVMTFRRPDGREFGLHELPTERVIKSGETVRAEEMIIELPDGERVTTVVNTAPIFSEEGEIVSVVATIQDMTPLEELERMRAEFLGKVSHQLRTPLFTIKGSTSAALDDPSAYDAAEMRQLLRIIDEQTDRMRNLISNLLDVTRIEAGILPVGAEPVRVQDIIEESLSAFKLGGAGYEIEVEISEGVPPVAADRRRIVQVLTILFSNSSRISPDSSVMRVGAAREDSHVLFTVAAGGSIDPELLPHLFMKHAVAGAGETDSSSRSAGWDLAICRGIVEAHGGRIWAESEGQGHGARFKFTIPLAVEVAEGSDNGANQHSGGPGSAGAESIRILALEGEPQVLRHVRKTLSGAGFTTIATTNPGEVEHLVEMENPRLILLDLMPAGTDGFSLMRRVSGISDAPIILLSDRSEDDIIERAFETGATDYVVKPFSSTELVARVRAALRRRPPSGEGRSAEPYGLGDLRIDYERRLVTVSGEPVRLTATEYKVLTELSSNAGRVLTYDQLLQRVWGFEYAGNPKLLQAFVKTIRRKLGDDSKDPSYIFTEFRVGYRMPRAGLTGVPGSSSSM